jgi:hypothetical protein
MFGREFTESFSLVILHQNSHTSWSTSVEGVGEFLSGSFDERLDLLFGSRQVPTPHQSQSGYENRETQNNQNNYHYQN